MTAAIDMLSKKPAARVDLPPVQALESAHERSRKAPESANERQRAPHRHLALVTSKAPAIETELPSEPEPDIDDVPEGEQRFKRLKLVSAVNDNVARYVEGDPLSGDVSLTLANEDKFVQFWGFDVWEYISCCISGTTGFDASEALETDESEREQAVRAAKKLYQATQKHPQLFGWMASRKTIEGGDWMIIFMFYGGKFGMLFREWQQYRKRKNPTAEAPA